MGARLQAANRTDRTGAVVHHQTSRARHVEAPGRGHIMTPRAGPLRILVVDDEPAILRFLHASLESQGYIVATAAMRTPLSTWFRRHTADLVVLDLGLPDMDASMSSAKSGTAAKTCRSSSVKP